MAVMYVVIVAFPVPVCVRVCGVQEESANLAAITRHGALRAIKHARNTSTHGRACPRLRGDTRAHLRCGCRGLNAHALVIRRVWIHAAW